MRNQPVKDGDEGAGLTQLIHIILNASVLLAMASMAGAQPSSTVLNAVLTSPSDAGQCEAQSRAGAEAVKRRARVALFYQLKLALEDDRVHEWTGDARPRFVMANVRHVAVSARHGYAIDAENRLWQWSAGRGETEQLLNNVAYAAAGESGVLAIRCDGSLWQRQDDRHDWARVAAAAIHAWVGDSADYFIDVGRRLHVAGKAHRGQYGNGRLEMSSGWVAVADEAQAVYSHTGHAVYLRGDGAVLGTGGNLAGPLGRHGYGDKAVRWGVIFEGASALGTGSRHTLAIRPDGTLWSWGAADGLEPRHVLSDVVEATGGDHETLALGRDGSVWNWRVGARPQKISPLR